MAEHHADVRFEPTDVRIGPIVGFLAILSTSLVVIMVGLWFAQSMEMSVHGDVERPRHELTMPPEPRIEGVGLDAAVHSVTNVDLPTSARSLRIEEEKKLADGWNDAAGGKHPPIEQAMKQFLEQLKKGGKK